MPPRRTLDIFAPIAILFCMTIERADKTDLPLLLALYAGARERMRAAKNPTQWGTHYPPEALLRDDIAKGQLYLVRAEEHLTGAFVFFCGEDPTYRKIDGAWLGEGEYGVIHRVASDGRTHGFLRLVVNWCSRSTSDLRIDTHRDNAPMRAALAALGFTACGVILTDDGSPRIAYERILP